MNELINEEKIEDLIYEIRGVQVMLDSDLARLYGCKNGTKEVNQAVKNNIEKFPERYMFRLSDEEVINLRSKFLTANVNSKSRINPTVFTEHGVYMLATILKGKKAANMTLFIMDAFVQMKQFLRTEVLNNEILVNHEERIIKLEESFAKFDKKKELNNMFFEGQFYDAYSLLLDILNSATKSIIIIDNYIDKKFLDICSKVEINIIIYTKEINKIDLEKYNKQYNNIKVRISNKYHDRFIILDYKILYHCGASFKDLGKKCFCISKIENNNILRNLIKTVNS